MRLCSACGRVTGSSALNKKAPRAKEHFTGGSSVRSAVWFRRQARYRYEDWWTLYRISDVLTGKTARIRLEPPMPEGLGIEFWIDEPHARWYEQAMGRRQLEVPGQSVG